MEFIPWSTVGCSLENILFRLVVANIWAVAFSMGNVVVLIDESSFNYLRWFFVIVYLIHYCLQLSQQMLYFHLSYFAFE